MVNTLAVGNIGDGKTNYVTMRAYMASLKGRKVFGNYNMSFSDGYINLDEVADSHNVEKYHGSVLNVDEGQIWFDSRNFGKPLNKLFSYIFLQARHRRLDFNVTAQQSQLVDIRFANNFDFFCLCTAMVYDQDLRILREATIYEIEAQVIARIRVLKVNMRDGTAGYFYYDPRPYFSMYDTLQFVDIGCGSGGSKTKDYVGSR